MTTPNSDAADAAAVAQTFLDAIGNTDPADSTYLTALIREALSKTRMEAHMAGMAEALDLQRKRSDT